MTQLAYTATTAGTTLAKVHKKLQGNLLSGFQTKCEEFARLPKLKDFSVNHSAREVTAPIDITRQPAGAFIPEGGYESNPITAAPQEVTVNWANYNARFDITRTARALDRHSRQSQIVRQLKYQTMKLSEGMANRIGYAFYGYSTGVMCKTSTDATATSQTLTLIDAFGLADVDAAAYLGRIFAVGDRIAVIRTADIIANGIGAITAVTPGTPSIDVTMIGSANVDPGDEIVFANSVENTSKAGTDYNVSPVGLLDMTLSTSVHSLSGASFPNWTVALNDSSGGRFDAVRLMKAQDEIHNAGGGEGDCLILSQGVKRDVFAQERAVLRWSSPGSMDLDGAIKASGLEIVSSRKTPPSRAWVLDKSAVCRWNLHPLPGEEVSTPDWGDEGFDKVQDRNADVYSFDFSFGFICKQRSNIAYFSGLTEQ